jgi:hypothetical protein
MRELQAAIFLLALLRGAESSAREEGDTPVAQAAAPEDYAALLERYVTPSGVRYADWKAHPEDLARLDRVVGFYAATRPPSEGGLSWHLNAYNAWILHRILAKYPAGGPLEGDPDFFRRESITISGKPTSFDAFEREGIFGRYRDPRAHFALNCASQSCPPLLSRPFGEAGLEADLDALARRFVNDNPAGVLPGRRSARISKIFDWYADDFGGKENLIPFINRYREQPLATGTAIEFLDYSWKLNAAP